MRLYPNIDQPTASVCVIIMLVGLAACTPTGTPTDLDGKEAGSTASLAQVKSGEPARSDVLTNSDTSASLAEPSQTAQEADDRVRVVSVPDNGIVPDAEIDDGVIHLAYFSDGNVYYVRSLDGGSSFSEPLRVNSELGFASGAAHRGPDLAVGDAGRIHVIWYNAAYLKKRPKEESGVMYSHLNAGADAFEPDRYLNGTPSDNFSIAADKNGHVAVIWMARGLFVNISNDGGESFSEPADMLTDPCECCASRTAYTEDGALTVLYRDKADDFRDMHLAVLAQGSDEVKHEKISQTPWYIAACPMTGGFLSADRDGLVAGWETKGEIYFTRLDNRGRYVAAGEIHVSDRGRYPVTLRSHNDDTLVAWKNGTELQWQLFDVEDKPKGPQGSKVTESSDRPSGVVTAEGKFVLFP